MTYALCNDGTRIYLEKAAPDYSNYLARCEAHGTVGTFATSSDADRVVFDHANSNHQGMHSHACARS
ncbi:hypothetical protein ACQP2Y_21280 [Actinoplanes sp. CA-051413]|uniref:hypothetical protein n=1 Tax=Actinoplanes sp. CA-051413 TaxID=3239899 RepID=UPI003D99020E